MTLPEFRAVIDLQRRLNRPRSPGGLSHDDVAQLRADMERMKKLSPDKPRT